MSELLNIENLKTHFITPEGIVKAVDGISFRVNKGETLALVGESGCGKTVTSLSIIRLLEDSDVLLDADKIDYKGKNLIDLNKEEMRKMRGKEISMIFQEPMTSLNPVFRVKKQLFEVFKTHYKMKKDEIMDASLDIMRKVGIPKPEERINSYPHELSGGLRQRVMIAISLACNPSLLIADEPTTALDVTIQAQIISLLKKMQKNLDMAILLITHDFGVVSEMADRVAVMYAGKIVEKGKFKEVFNKPLHPYTYLLIKSIPGAKTKKRNKLETIKGMVPNPLKMPEGCRFHPRCPYRMDICSKKEPSMQTIDTHSYACWLEGGILNG